jgi:DNA-binding transcriptional LysR family regulator
MSIRNADRLASAASEDGEALLRAGLKLGHMRMIVALEDHGQISAAAQVLNISQPAASRMIAEVEDILSVAICERLPRGVRLTAYGSVLARRARAILLEMREAGREIADLRAGRGGTVFLGAVTAPAIELAVPAIRKMRERFPRITIDMQVETSAVLARELIAQRHDFIIGRVPDDLNPRLFRGRVIGVERACLIARKGHPLLDGDTVDPDRLADYDWVLQPGGSLLRRTMEGIFLTRGIRPPERVLDTSSLLLTLVMVAQSDAIAAVSVQVAKFIKEDIGGGIDVLPIDFPIEVQPYSLITLRDRRLSPAAQMLHDHILDQIG